MTPHQQQIHQEKIAYWQPYITQWRKSGLKAKAFCHQHSLNHPQFKYWQYQLAPDTKHSSKLATQQPSLFTEVTPQVVSHLLPSTGIELITPRGYCLKIPARFDTQTLSQLLNVMGDVLC